MERIRNMKKKGKVAKAMANKQISFTYEDMEYTLEFSRNTIRQMERGGFRFDKISEEPATYIPMLFEGAFLANHRRVKSETINGIFNSIQAKDELIPKLAAMYQEALSTLMEDPKDDAKKVTWEANF